MKLALFQRRTVTMPTPFGWICILLLGGSPLVGWCLFGERLLSPTRRLSAEVLVVEAWIGPDGVEAAGHEFKETKNGYQFIVAVGGLTGERWTRRRWNLVEMAERELTLCGIPRESIIGASVADMESQRTFAAATATRQALSMRGVHPKAINVFTRGPHARRSRLIFAKVFGSKVEIGVISWIPIGYTDTAWWRSSGRARDLLTESAGYVYEAAFSSGRGSTITTDGPP